MHADLLDSPATVFRAATTGSALDVAAEIVVDGQLFTAANRAEAHVQNVALHDAADEIRLAAMIDDLRAAAADGAVECPVSVHAEQIGVIAFIAPLGLMAIDALTGVFDHFAAGRDFLGGVDSVAVKARLADDQTVTGIARIEQRDADQVCHSIT